MKLAALLAVLLCLSAAPARAGFFSSVKNAAHKVGDAAHDATLTLGKQVDKTADTVTHEIIKSGQVVGQAVVKDGKIVQEKTIQAGKVVNTEEITGAHFLVKDGKIVGREIEQEGKIVGSEIVKDGTVVGHALAKDAAYVVESGELMLKPMPMPGDFPPPAAKKNSAQRLAECGAAKEPDCYAKHQMPTEAGIPKNCLYGWSVGAGHPASNSNPPDYAKTLNALDQCAWFHDRGAWKYNAVTHVCETYEMCSNSMGLKRCVDRVKPQNAAEAAAKECFTKYFQPVMDICVDKFYKDWGAEFSAGPAGEQWLSAGSVAQLRAAMKKCPSVMKHPGFAGL